MDGSGNEVAIEGERSSCYEVQRLRDIFRGRGRRILFELTHFRARRHLSEKSPVVSSFNWDVLETHF